MLPDAPGGMHAGNCSGCFFCAKRPGENYEHQRSGKETPGGVTAAAATAAYLSKLTRAAGSAALLLLPRADELEIEPVLLVAAAAAACLSPPARSGAEGSASRVCVCRQQAGKRQP